MPLSYQNTRVSKLLLQRKTLYQFTCLPNGLRSGPRKSTKLPLFSCLRSQQVTATGFVDDLITLDRRFVECKKNIKLTVAVLNSLGFVVHSDKSIFLPIRSTEYLGSVTDFKSITNHYKVSIKLLRQGELLGSLEKLQNYQVRLQVAFLQ